MSKISNTNYNHISVKTDSMVKMVKELAKLGVFKSKSKKRAKSAVADAIRQDSDMVGYTKTLGGPQMRNLPPIQQIEAGLSQRQIDDIQRRNDAIVAALRNEVQQQRLEDIEELEGQRFADIQAPQNVINPVLERFRSSSISEDKAAAKLDAEPDTQETRFTESLNEGGPEATAKRQTDVFPDEGEEDLPFAEARFETRTPIRGFPQTQTGIQINKPIRGSKKSREETDLIRRNNVLQYFNLDPLPPPVLTNIAGAKSYYEYLMEKGVEPTVEESSLKTKNDYYKAIYEMIDGAGASLPKYD